jgi:hypothetical protein
MNTLRFLSTVTVDEFKAEQGIDRIDIFRHEKSGKNFFAYGNERGAVYSKYPSEPLKEPMISHVETSEGEKFFMLHNKGDGGATKMATL